MNDWYRNQKKNKTKKTEEIDIFFLIIYNPEWETVKGQLEWRCYLYTHEANYRSTLKRIFILRENLLRKSIPIFCYIAVCLKADLLFKMVEIRFGDEYLCIMKRNLKRIVLSYFLLVSLYVILIRRAKQVQDTGNSWLNKRKIYMKFKRYNAAPSFCCSYEELY